MPKDFKIKKDTLELPNKKTISGYYLSNLDYAQLRNVPPQTIIEENTRKNKRIPFRRTIYVASRESVFVSTEKPLYNHIEAKLFRIELMQDSGKPIEIINNEEVGLRGYWVSKAQYCLLTGLSATTVSYQLSQSIVELGQFYEKSENSRYRFFIPIDQDPYTTEEVENFITKKMIISIDKDIESLNEKFSNKNVLTIAKLARDKKFMAVSEKLKEMDSEEVETILYFVQNFTKEDVTGFMEFKNGYQKLFGNG